MATATEQWTPVQDGKALAPPSRVSLAWLVHTALFFSFLLALLQYQINLGGSQFLHLGAFFLAGVLVLCGARRAQRLQHLFNGGGVLLAAVLFSEVISYTSGDTYSLLYGLIFVGVILSARLIVLEIGVPNVVRAYSQAAMVTVVLLVLLGRRTLLLDSGGRSSAGTVVHPNLLAFVLGGFLPAILWRALEYKVRWKQRAAALLTLLGFLFIFRAGSRGTLFALILSGLALASRRLLGRYALSRLRIRHWHIILVLFVLTLLTAYVVQNHRVSQVGDYLDTSLALTNSQRGIHSGLSGRTGIWHLAFVLLRERNRWLFGFGYRMGDRLVGTIDNGYVQLLFDSGLIAGCLILGCMLRVFLLLWQASRSRENNAWTRYHSILWCIMIVYFFNNISTRYLFSFGSSFSLLIMLLSTASRQELLGPAAVTRAQPKPEAARRPRPLGRLVWDRAGR